MTAAAAGPAGYNKRGGVFCVNPKKPLPLRDGSAVLQPGSSSCYKAVYFNIERATYIMAGAWAPSSKHLLDLLLLL
jgi:hypothetical protein